MSHQNGSTEHPPRSKIQPPILAVSPRIPVQHPAILGGSIGQGTSVTLAAKQIAQPSIFVGPEQLGPVNHSAERMTLTRLAGALFTYRDPEED